MRSLLAWWRRALALIGGRSRAGQFDAELESHLELHIDENLRRGMTPEAARRDALVALGGLQSVRERIAIAAAFRRSTPSRRTSASPSACCARRRGSRPQRS